MSSTWTPRRLVRPVMLSSCCVMREEKKIKRPSGRAGAWGGYRSRNAPIELRRGNICDRELDRVMWFCSLLARVDEMKWGAGHEKVKEGTSPPLRCGLLIRSDGSPGCRNDLWTGLNRE